MALIHVNFVSKSLFRSVNLAVILPVDKIFNEEQEECKPFKTLYLLHGLLGSEYDWISGTRIQRWAEEKNLAVVMPAGENGFYVDHPGTDRMYGEFIGKELVEMTRKMFPLSTRREDTFIGGLSMGGYGAIRNGLKYNDTFSHIISLSGALHFFEDQAKTRTQSIGKEEASFGDMEAAKKSDVNPKVLIETTKENLPKVFMAVGTEDSLLYANRIYKDYFNKNEYDLTYIEAKGGHEWDFWDTYIYEALKWLPLDDAKQGINSGNVQ